MQNYDDHIFDGDNRALVHACYLVDQYQYLAFEHGQHSRNAQIVNQIELDQHQLYVEHTLPKNLLPSHDQVPFGYDVCVQN